MAASYAIRPATVADVPALGVIETRAAERFRGLVPDEIAQDNVPEPTLRAAASAGRLFVAEASDGTIAGFALVVLLDDGSAHLEELDVLPDHGRQGVGTALVEATCRWAKANGHPALTLTTYRDVPWNAPYYERLGFRELPEPAWTPELRAIREREAKHGLDEWPRVCMRREL